MLKIDLRPGIQWRKPNWAADSARLQLCLAAVRDEVDGEEDASRTVNDPFRKATESVSLIS